MIVLILYQSIKKKSTNLLIKKKVSALEMCQLKFIFDHLAFKVFFYQTFFFLALAEKKYIFYSIMLAF
jgi:hypothetical protein